MTEPKSQSSRRKFRPRRSRLWPLAAIGLLALLGRYAIHSWHEPARMLQYEPISEGTFDVVRVVDGQTLVVRRAAGHAANRSAGELQRVRLLGIACPVNSPTDSNVDPWGAQATEFTREFVAAGKVQLRLDDRRIDPQGRYLAYVFVGVQMLNAELVRAGLARVAAYPGDSQSMARKLRSAEEEAKQARRGIWSEVYRQTRCLRTPSRPSFPPSVALPQLPSSSSCARSPLHLVYSLFLCNSSAGTRSGYPHGAETARAQGRTATARTV